MSSDLVKRARAQMAKAEEHIKSIGGEVIQQGFMPLLCDRIEELEAELAEYKHVASAIDKQWAESQDEIADLKANLVEAVEALRFYGGVMPVSFSPGQDGGARARATLAELKGKTDE